MPATIEALDLDNLIDDLDARISESALPDDTSMDSGQCSGVCTVLVCTVIVC
ncbi:hypothetical protein GCM10009801_65470 [Streptomyces albiaxialis]|uniref:Lantibiotic n=1 Tax=Streptomyces albiaxialis TaxID=329523 RepID=A0ABP5IDH6_9ACTN